MTVRAREICQGAVFKGCAVALALYGSVLSVGGFVLGPLTADGQADTRQRWFEIRHFVQRLDPLEVMGGRVAALEGVEPVYIGGYPPWSYVIGSVFIPPVACPVARVIFTAFQMLALAGLLALIYRVSVRGLGTSWAGLFFCGLFLAFPGLATDLKWGNYTTIVLFCLAACAVLSGSASRSGRWAAAALYAVAFIKPQLAALFGLVLLFKGLWRVWVPAGLMVAVCTAGASLWLREPPWSLLGALADSTVRYRELYSYANFYNYGLLDIGKVFGLPLAVLARFNLVLGVGGVCALLRKYAGQVPEVTLWAIPATFVPLWAYNQKYDWQVVFLLVFAVGLEVLRGGVVGRRAWLLGFCALVALSLTVTFKLLWFSYEVNAAVQFAVRVVWLAALLALLRAQKRAVGVGQAA